MQSLAKHEMGCDEELYGGIVESVPNPTLSAHVPSRPGG